MKIPAMTGFGMIKPTHAAILMPAVFSLLVIFVICYSQFPVFAIPIANHDDGLFFRSFSSILRGEWLGDYDNKTLAKGPLLPILTALANSIGLHWKLLEGIIYAVMVYFLARISVKINLPGIITLMLVFFLIANPHIWDWSGRRYSREVLYQTFSLALLLLAVITVTRKSIAGAAFSAFVFGLIGGALYLTREEDIWMIAVVLFATLFVTARNVFLDRSWPTRTSWQLMATKIMLSTLGFMAALSPVLLLNQSYYGRAITSEFRTPEFKRAMGALMRVGDVHPSGYVPVPHAAMQAVFDAIPAASPIRPHWDRVSARWSKYGHREELTDLHSNDILGGWFAWAFRDAVASAGFHTSLNAAMEYYGNLGDEINAACDIGILDCRRRRDTLAPEIPPDRYSALISSLWHALQYTIFLKAGSFAAPVSQGNPDLLKQWKQTIGQIHSNIGSTHFISGWIANKSSTSSIQAFNIDDFELFNVTIHPGDDIVDHYAKRNISVHATRFSLNFICQNPECSMAISNNNGDHVRVDLGNVRSGRFAYNPPFWGWIDEATIHATPIMTGTMRTVQAVAKISQAIIPLLCLIGILALIIYPVTKVKSVEADYLFIFSLCAASAVFLRCGIIAYIDATSWKAITTFYLGPAYGFVIVFAVSSVALAQKLVTVHMKSRSLCTV